MKVQTRRVPVMQGVEERSAMQWLIIDTTPRSQVSLPAEGHAGLQSLVSDSMALPLDFVQSVWVPVSLAQARRATFPGEAQECASVIVDRELEQVQLYLQQQGMSLDGMQTLILTDEIESSPSVVGRFVVRLC